MLCDLLTLVSLRPYDRGAQRKEKKEREQQRLERMARGEPSTKKRKPQNGSQAFQDSPAAQRAVRELDEEGAKAGGWRRIYPAAHGGHYRHLFAVDRPLNSFLCDLLAKRESDNGIAPALMGYAPSGAAFPVPSIHGISKHAPHSSSNPHGGNVGDGSGGGADSGGLPAAPDAGSGGQRLPDASPAASKADTDGGLITGNVAEGHVAAPPTEITVEVHAGSWAAPHTRRQEPAVHVSVVGM